MPKEGAKAEAAIIREIGRAKSAIVLTMYSFTNGNIAKALKDAAKRGVKIVIVVDEKTELSGQKNARAGEMAKIKGVVVRLARGDRAKSGEYYGIMHLKVAIIDERLSIYGSANWTASAFNINHEIVFIDDSEKLARELLKSLEPLIKSSREF